jgi:hypothetical protein
MQLNQYLARSHSNPAVQRLYQCPNFPLDPVSFFPLTLTNFYLHSSNLDTKQRILQNFNQLGLQVNTSTLYY